MSSSKNNAYIKKIMDASGSIVMPSGFKAGAVYCGLKTDNTSFDIGIIFSEKPCSTAAVFTNNKIFAAPVKFSRNILKNGNAKAIIVNSGNANACTGERGYKDTEEMAKIAAGHLGIKPEEIMVASTGIIGHHLQMDKVSTGIKEASQSLGKKKSHGSNIAKAILTTDKTVKESAVEVKTDTLSFTIGGIAKGSGMIAPDMATMLAFITTDASISKEHLDICLKNSVKISFNRITVDGHTSTNDMVAIMANGANANDTEITSESELAIFEEALDCVTQDLAKQIVKDGEGATKFIQIDINGAETQIDADKIARSIANSPLVKTAINGEDYNWGRIVSAAGYAGAKLDENLLQLFVNGILTFKNGCPVNELANLDNEFLKRLKNEMKKNEIIISLELGLGSESVTMWTCDLSHEYITINAEYHT